MTPDSKIPVISYEKGLDLLRGQEYVVLLAWNFQEEIINDLRSFGYQGQFIVPLPGEPRLR